MGRIAVYENPADTSEFSEYEHSGPVIDFLTKHFPTGFGGRQHLCAFNQHKLEVADYDRVVGPGDFVALVIVPAGPAAAAVAAIGAFIASSAVAQIVVSIVVAQVLNFAINKFFGPKGSKPSSPTSTAGLAARGELPAASSTYALTAPSNTVRLGQPIPVPYGRNLIVPDIASQPYSWFTTNDNYVGMILCLGQGYYDIHSVQVGNSPVDQLAPGVVSYTVFTPADHQSSFGLIGNATGIQENVYTSPEVSDQELDAIGAGAPPTDIGGNGGWIENTTPVNLSNVYPLTPIPEGQEGPGAYTVLNYQPTLLDHYKRGNPVWLGLSGGSPENNGTWPITYYDELTTHTTVWVEDILTGQGQYVTTTTYRVVFKVTTTNPDGLWVEQSPDVISNAFAGLTPTDPNPVNPDTPSGMRVGPFAATPPGIKGTWLQYDIVFPNGCYEVDEASGNIAPFSVSLSFVATEINDNGVAIGSDLRQDHTFTLATTTAQRFTLDHVVPYGRYKVAAYRTSPKSSRASSQSNLHWVNLKAYVGNTFPDSDTYGDVTLLVVKAKATNGLASDALSKFSVDCTRKLNGVATRNPIDALTDIITNPTYGGNRPTTEIDWEKFNELKADWADKYFDAVYDTSTNLWDAMGMTVQVQHAAPTMSGSLITLVEDKKHTIPQFALNEEQIKELTLTFIFPDGNEVDGVEGEYRDSNDNAQLFAIYPADSVNPEQVTIWGCRDYDTALAFVTQRWNQLRLRRLLISAKIELYGHVIPVGAPVCITHRNLRDVLGNNDGVLCVVQSVSADDEYSLTIDAHRHEPDVYP